MTPSPRSPGCRIITAVGAESQLADLVSLSCALAAPHKGQVTLLHVTPGGERPAWLDVPKTCHGVQL
ncbi:MAG: hypothetical protein ACK2U9_04395, partial [Anaerolineae bacterium]